MQHRVGSRLQEDRQRRRPRRSAQALLLGAFTALCLTGVSAAPALAAPAPGSITGSITVPAGTASASDVSVVLADEGGQQVDSTSVTATGATTGTYEFADEAPGQYYVYFYDDDDGDNVAPDYYGDGNTDNITKASLITLASGGAVTLNDASLSAGATISGSISDANSAINTNAYVFLDPVYSGANPDPLAYYNSNSYVLGDSSYSLAGIPAGTYEVEYYASGENTSGVYYYYDVFVSGSGLTYDYDNGGQYSVSAGSTSTVNIAVPALGEVSGTVSGPTGPAGNDGAWLYDSFGDIVAATSTAGDGTYSMLALPGTYKANFGGLLAPNLAPTWYGGATEAQATGISVTAGGTTANINVTLGAGATISGAVVAAQGGAPVGGLGVDVFDAQGNYIANTDTMPNGTYTIPDLPAGTWYVEFTGGEADNGTYYASEFYGGTQSEFGATPVTLAAGQSATVDGALLPAGVSALGMPKVSGGALSGLHDNKVALKFRVTAGASAGYLHSFTVALPKGFSWNAGQLTKDLSLGSGVTFTHAITSGKLVITLASGQPSVAFSLKAGGIKVTKAIEKAAGGTTTTKKKKGKKLAATAKAKKKKKPAKAKDTIKSETIKLTVSDTTGVATSLSFVVKKPH